MLDHGGMVAFGACFACGRLFLFNPELVPSVPVDPQTGAPPDVDPKPGGYQRAVRQPICGACVLRINARRRELGQAIIEVLPGAYDMSEGAW
jgi:hypothetical protein